MKIPDLLVRGMLAGIIGAVFATGFAFAVGEPPIERAIAIEEQRAVPAPHVHDATMPASATMPMGAPTVSRGVQRTLGLVTGLLILGLAFGGVFAILFALARGRLGVAGDRGMALTVALLAFVSLYLVPFLKYPANPPAVGAAETIGARTVAYVGLLVISVLLTIAAVLLQRLLAATRSNWDASIIAGVACCTLMAAVGAVLPGFAEVPAAFPADLLWQFRLASIGTQLTLWLGIGLVFGIFMDRAKRQSND